MARRGAGAAGRSTRTARKPAKKTTRRSPAKKAASPKKPAAAAAPPARLPVPEGHRLRVLSVPFEERQVAAAAGARWDPGRRATVYIGPGELPAGLAPYAARLHSWERFLEDLANPGDLHAPTAPAAAPPMTLRPHQAEAADRIERAARRGYRGFLLADDVGLGKTLSALDGARRVLADRGGSRLLIVSPKAVLPHWRNSIDASTLAATDTQTVVINYEQASKLLDVPASATAAKRTRTKNKRIAASGTPLVQWDVVVFDESHYLKNPHAQRTQIASNVARYAAAAGQAPFVIWASATAGQDPVALSYLAPLLAQVTGAKRSDLKDYGQWLADQGFAVTHNARFDKWEWGVGDPDASEADKVLLERRRDQDLDRVRAMLFEGADAPGIRRLPTDVAGWPEMLTVPDPIELSAVESRQYDEAWTAFRAEMRLVARGSDPRGGMVARLRFRQKASLIRVAATVDRVMDLLTNGQQVVVSVEFLETAEALIQALAARKVSAAEFTGRNVESREAERLRFQRGEAPVIVFSVAEGISLHAGERLPDGTAATLTPRATVIHDPRYSGLVALQIQGRAHRDGQFSKIYYTYATATVEEHVVRVLLARVRSTKQMLGDDVTAVREMEDLVDRLAAGDSADLAAPADGMGQVPDLDDAAPAPHRTGLAAVRPPRAVAERGGSGWVAGLSTRTPEA